MRYCNSPFSFQRRQACEVVVGKLDRGGVVIGGNHPVLIQSMITSDTMNTAACVKETIDLAAAGSQLVRITAPTVKDAANLKVIIQQLRAQGCLTPIAADIHFKPEAGLEAAKWVEKVRINPGNFADTKKFDVKEYTGDQYAAELARIEQKFAPLVEFCRDHSRAMRIGTNHGSLSDRILNRFGDTPAGMVESALEFAQIARKRGYHDFLFSMKASNVKVMVQSYRLLVAQMNELGDDWNYPLHLGVTEAGEGEDGRIKSAIGIGALLADGLGDTIRVSLTEDSIHEIPVCRDLLAQIPHLASGDVVDTGLPLPFDPFNYQRRATPEIELAVGVKCGGQQPVRVVVTREVGRQIGPRFNSNDNVRAEAVYEELDLREVNPTTDFDLDSPNQLVTVKDGLGLPVISAFRLLAGRLKKLGANNPILLKDCLVLPEPALDSKIALLRASVAVGALLVDGIGDAVLIRNEPDPERLLLLAYNILQAAGCRSFKTEYIACPSCGRTLFNLQTVTARIKARTQHLKGVKIAIMGCIVNGPGEMADADFGYVGGAPGKINLYVGKKPVRFNIPETEAVNRLVDLIREHGKWSEPDSR